MSLAQPCLSLITLASLAFIDVDDIAIVVETHSQDVYKRLTPYKGVAEEASVCDQTVLCAEVFCEVLVV